MSVVAVTFKQYRLELLLALLVAAAVTGLWVLFVLRLPAGIPAQCQGVGASLLPECGSAVEGLRPAVFSVGVQIIELMRVAPLAMGLLLGVPIVSREIESGTVQTAWSLNGSRVWWLTRQLTITIGPIVVVVSLMALAAGHVEGLRQTTGDGAAVLNVGAYGAPAVLRLLAAAMLGLMIGALLGRSLPAFVLAAILCGTVVFVLGQARDRWMEALPSDPIPTEVTSSIATGWAYRAPSGAVISTEEAWAQVPPEVAAADAGQVQPVNTDVWLEANGFELVSLGVSHEATLEWAKFDMLAFGVITLGALGTTVLSINRRRPAS